MEGSVAVVTGANKGIGFEICKQLAAKGITVVVTARDVERGAQAIEKLKASGISEHILLFHQLDLCNQSSVDSLVDFIKHKFGKLDILMNNAGVSGVMADQESYRELLNGHMAEMSNSVQKEDLDKAKESETDTYEWAEQCMETNYYGTKRVTEAFIPLLLLSDAPRIVNVSSPMGMLKYLSNEWAIGVLSNVDELTEDKVDEVIKAYLKDRKDGSYIVKGWPAYFSAYKLSKAVLNAYTRIMAKKYPKILINAVDPGFVKTDLTFNLGFITPEEGGESPVNLALLPKGGPSGLFFERNEVGSF
ncbi:hypothetical protein Leryth_001806 [Lithospermum erythrorhizon]|nr:hypothetical protein Leryth_001806 [Lithospermum erythrorhizon]